MRQQRPRLDRSGTATGSRMRRKRPILSTTQASCWGTNSTTVFMGRLDAHRCRAGVAHNLGPLRRLCCRGETSVGSCTRLSDPVKFWNSYKLRGHAQHELLFELNNCYSSSGGSAAGPAPLSPAAGPRRSDTGSGASSTPSSLLISAV